MISCEFRAGNDIHSVRSRTVSAVERDPVSKTQQQNKTIWGARQGSMPEIPVPREAGAGGAGVQGHLQLHSECEASQDNMVCHQSINQSIN